MSADWASAGGDMGVIQPRREPDTPPGRVAAGFDDLAPAAPDGNKEAAAATLHGWSPNVILANFRLGGEEVPPLVAAAAPLLSLAHELRQRDDAPDLAEMRPAVIEAVRRYERDLATSRISPERARAAHYVICATIDDVVLSKPWSERGNWSRSGLVSTFHMDVTGGDRVFDLLDHFHQSPGANKDLLLLIYLCLSLAFEGRTRVSPRGSLELSRIRESLYRTLLGQYGVFERELSPHWRGVAARHKPLRTATVLWTLLSLLALALALAYLLMTFSLNRASDGTFRRLAELEPREAPSLAQTVVVEAADESVPVPSSGAAAPPPVAAPSVEPAEPPPDRVGNLLAFLQPEVESGLVALSDDNGRLRVRIANSGLFDIGSAQVDPQFRGLLERIGGALSAERFEAIVVGYTDDVPIRTAEFPSNFALSEARAKAVGDVLAAYTGADAIKTEGRADSDPLASNDTAEGREMNRRTEILVLTDAAERLQEAGMQSMGAPTPAPAAPPSAEPAAAPDLGAGAP